MKTVQRLALALLLSSACDGTPKPFHDCEETKVFRIAFVQLDSLTPSRRTTQLDFFRQSETDGPVTLRLDPNGDPHVSPALEEMFRGAPPKEELFTVEPDEVTVPGGFQRASVTIRLLGEGPIDDRNSLRLWVQPLGDEHRCSVPTHVPLNYGARCGDGVVDAPEMCDRWLDEMFCAWGETSCQVCNRCQLVAGTPVFCGDGRIDGPEACDGPEEVRCADRLGRRYTGMVRCRADCQWDYSGCIDTMPPPSPPGDEVGCLLEDDGGLSCFGTSAVGLSRPPRDSFTRLAMGLRHACALGREGRVRCWGEGTAGQLEVPDASFLDVGVGDGFSCGLTLDGEARCWGRSDSGVLAAPSGRFESLVVGTHHACALDAEGRPVCWGNRSAGQASPPDGGRFAQVSAGRLVTCGRGVDGGAACWGRLPRATPDDAPWPLPAQWSYRDLALGGDRVCALRSDGVPVCVGTDYPPAPWPPQPDEGVIRLFRGGCYESARGYVGCGAALFPRPDGGVLDAVFEGPRGACIATPDGPALCQGSVDAGLSRLLRLRSDQACAIDDQQQVVDCDVEYDLPPPQFTGTARAPTVSFVEAFRQRNFACGLRPQGTIVCWGRPRSPYVAPPAGTYVDVTTAYDRACAVSAGGELRCWGEFDGGTRLWPGRYDAVESDGVAVCALTRDAGAVVCDERCQPPDCVPPPGQGFRQLVMSSWSACVLGESGAVTCFKEPQRSLALPHRRLVAGGNGFAAAQSADGRWRSLHATSPLAFPETGDLLGTARSRDVRGGDGRLCVRSERGELVCLHQGAFTSHRPLEPPGAPLGAWGVGIGGPCRLGSDGRAVCASQVPPPAQDFVDIDVRVGSPCGATVSGAVVCWGDAVGPWGRRRFFGTGNAVAVGPTVSCARDAASNFWTCGGDERFGLVPAPRRPFTTVVLGDDGRTACGLNDGQATCWGAGASDQRPPFDVYTRLSLGLEHGCGVTVGGAVRCWGRPWAPVPADTLRDVAVGSDFSCGVRAADDRLVCWGRTFNVNVREP